MIRTPSASWARTAAARTSTAACMGRVDILTGTLGKALGGASGGYTSGRSEIIELLRQRSRPYLFSNTLAAVIAAAIAARARPARGSPTNCASGCDNTRFFRAADDRSGFRSLPGEHPIVPVMLGDAALAADDGRRLLARGRLCHRLLLSGRAAGQGAHPHADVGGAHAQDLEQAIDGLRSVSATSLESSC